MPDVILARGSSAPSSERVASVPDPYAGSELQPLDHPPHYSVEAPRTVIASNESEWSGELTALESRADVDSLEDLQRRRRQIVEQNASLMARYGSFGMADDYRKQFVECQKLRARMDLTKEGAKVTEGMVDAAAYGSDAYAAFLDNALAEKVAYLKAQNEIDELNEKIRSREIALLSYNAELKLAR